MAKKRKCGFASALFALAGPWLVGCSQTPRSSAAFDGAKALEQTAALVAIRPRDAGSAGAHRAAQHLGRQLEELGYRTAIDSFTETTSGGAMSFHNVLGRLPGKTQRLIVLGSHFDTKSGISPDFQGANDSGSSSGLLLELARVLAQSAPHETELLIAFFDGEECVQSYGARDGLHGSRRLARQLVEAGGAQHVEAVIVVDMVGDRDLNITVPRNSSKTLIRMLFSAAHEVGTRPVFRLADGGVLDDHVPFLNAGMPAIDVIDFDFGSAPGLNDYWHTIDDSMDKLSADSLQTVGDTVLRLVETLQ